MSFIDETTVTVIAGAGGDGVVSWHREPYKPKGGPDGGDGGDGGSVIFRADASIATLLDLRDRPHIKATKGAPGSGDRRSGGSGEDRLVLLPPGTVIHESDVLIADLANPGDELVAARGGRGGKGNAQFATATRRAPDFAEKGEPGEQRKLRLELRLLADAGLVGFPNAGKSTLISRISAARPKIADYPFTTLTPNLGVVKTSSGNFVVADIPGLLPGASEGKGLGHQFLRHVRRAAVLVFLVDLGATDRDASLDVEVLARELEAFDPELAERPRIVVASKVDIARERLDEIHARVPEALPISAVTGEGIDELLEVLERGIDEARAAAPPAVGYVRHIVREDPVRVEREDDAWRVRGRQPERAVATTNLESEEAVQRLQRRLISMGVERALIEAGAVKGDEVRIATVDFDFDPDDKDTPE